MGSASQARDSHGRWTAGSDAAAAGAHTKGIQKIKPWGSGRPAKGQAARDRTIRGKMVDQSHYGVPGDMAARLDKLPMTPKAGITATPGRFQYQPPKR
jgi:hypothetical protein